MRECVKKMVEIETKKAEDEIKIEYVNCAGIFIMRGYKKQVEKFNNQNKI